MIVFNHKKRMRSRERKKRKNKRFFFFLSIFFPFFFKKEKQSRGLFWNRHVIIQRSFFSLSTRRLPRQKQKKINLEKSRFVIATRCVLYSHVRKRSAGEEWDPSKIFSENSRKREREEENGEWIFRLETHEFNAWQGRRWRIVLQILHINTTT